MFAWGDPKTLITIMFVIIIIMTIITIMIIITTIILPTLITHMQPRPSAAPLWPKQHAERSLTVGGFISS